MFRFTIWAWFSAVKESGFEWPACAPETPEGYAQPPSAESLALKEELDQAFMREGVTLTFTEWMRGTVSAKVTSVGLNVPCGGWWGDADGSQKMSGLVMLESPCFRPRLNAGLGLKLGEWMGTQSIRDGALTVTTQRLEVETYAALTQGEGEGTSCTITSERLYDASLL